MGYFSKFFVCFEQIFAYSLIKLPYFRKYFPHQGAETIRKSTVTKKTENN